MLNPFNEAQELKRTQSEFRLQVAVVKHLEGAFRDLMWTAFPGRPGDAKDGYMKKMMGVKSGVPDLLFWWENSGIKHFGAIELKTEKGRINPDQNRFFSYFTNIGGKVAICRSVQEIHNTLIGWGLKPEHHSVIEPDIRTEQKKFADNFDFYKP